MTIPTHRMRVEADGDPNSKIILIGEGPSNQELQEGRPFVGPAGGVLEQCMHGAKITRSECYVTNVFKEKVTKNAKKDIYLGGAMLWSTTKGFTDAAKPYLDELRHELEQLNGNVLVPMGNPALEAIAGLKGITKWRGSILYCQVGSKYFKTIPTIHPSASLQSGDYLVRYYIISDLKRVKEESLYPQVALPPQVMLITNEFSSLEHELTKIYRRGLTGETINFDLEILNHEISHISFATNLHEGFCVPFYSALWSAHEEIALWRLIQKILGNPKIAKSNQYIIFDIGIIAQRMHIVTRGRIDDPMIANHIVYPDFPKKLAFLTSIHTRIPYYKDDGKTHRKILDENNFRRYNIQDSLTSAECLVKGKEELTRTNHVQDYEFTMQLCWPLLAMMYRGMKADRIKLEITKKEAHAQEKEYQRQLDEMCGGPLNVNSSAQCIDYFYTKKGIEPYRDRKTGSKTCDDKALARLIKGTSTRPGIPEAKLVQQVRGMGKLISTYLEMSFDDDSRMRCSYDARGTTTGRLSSSKTIFDTGMNMQNLPPEFKQFLVADDGYILIELDKTQAEWVVVAYYGGDARMIEVCEKQLDPHTRTAELISGVPPELIKKESKIIGHETNPDTLLALRTEHFPELLNDPSYYIPRTMGLRQCGKKSNHGLNYGMGYAKFALTNEVPDNEAKVIVNKYHQAYPMIRAGYHSSIQKQLADDRTVVNAFGDRRTFLDRWNPELFNAAYDYVAQSTVAKLINKGMLAIYNDTTNLSHLELLAQVHDSILFQLPLKFGLNYIAEAILICMDYLNPWMEYQGRRFQIRTDVKLGLSWGGMTEVTFEPTVDGLARRIYEVLTSLGATTSISHLVRDSRSSFGTTTEGIS